MDGITDRAGARLAALLEQANGPEGKSIRFITTERGEELRIDDPGEQDKMFEYAERTVLVVDPKTVDKFTGRQLDFRDNRFCIV